MKRALIAAVGLTVTGLVVSASPAFAFDCIRVSSSQQGLMQSTKSGNWLYFTIHDLLEGAVADGEATPEQAACVEEKWTEMGEPSYFALGIGVAGARGATQSGRITDQDFYELAKDAPSRWSSTARGSTTSTTPSTWSSRPAWAETPSRRVGRVGARPALRPVYAAPTVGT